MRWILVFVLAVAAFAQSGAYGDLSVDFSYHQSGSNVVVEGFVKNSGSIMARQVTIEAQCLEGKDDSAATWNYSTVIKDVSGGGKRSFRFSKPASPQARVQMRVVKVDY